MTLDDIKARCHINDDGCWVWKGAISDGKWPRVWAPDHSKPGSPMRSQPGRRAVWNVKTGRPIPNGWRVYGTCECDRCLNPAHLKCGPTEELGQHIQKTGKFKGQAKRIAANRATGKARAKTTPEMLAEIVSSTEPGTELSRRLNISRQIISRARNGKSGMCWQPIGGMFSQLMGST